MGFMNGLKKMGLVAEEVSYPNTGPAAYEGYEDSALLPEVDLSSIEGEAAEEIISSIYSQGEFTEDKCIYRMQDFINSLPSEMPKQTKYVSMGAILNASRVDILDLIADAQTRISLLQAAHDALKEEHEKLCEEANQQISEYLAAVEAAKVRMQDSQTHTVSTCDIIEAEAAQIKELMDFADGVISATSGG